VGSGIGYATARLFLAEGAEVAGVMVRAESFAKWQDVDDMLPLQGDIGDPGTVEAMVAEAERTFGKLDVVCNIAGIHDQLNPIGDTSYEQWDRIMDVDLKAPFRICKAAIPGMVARGGGAIVNYGSLAAERGLHGPSYCAAKAGLIGMTLSIAVQYGGKGIRCNVINSGGVHTEITNKSPGELHPHGYQLFRDITAKYPVPWVAQPEEMAPTVLFLASDEARHVNGAVIALDGGMAAC
jgi:NAD(P)-dependent dehydrogenase (short-subunit alcohol dehydrogenase family)